MSDPISTFSFPTTTLFGPGTLALLPGRLRAIGVKRPLVVTDAGLLATPAFASLKTILSAAGEFGVFSGVHPNPIEKDVIEGAEAYRRESCDGIVAFGGGSALDVGKAIRLLLKRPAMNLADFRYEDDWLGLVPCACIPTTAGTGSEVGRSSVIVLEKTGRKTVFFHPGLLANFVILDPEVTVGLPPFLTATTGADALTHCIESFTAPIFHPLCDGIALEGIHLIIKALPVAVRDGKDLEARGKMLVAAAMGAISFQKDLGATHSMAHPLSTLCGMHHGLANALCLPTVMRFNSQRKPGLYRRVGIAAGLDVMKATDPTADQATIAFLEDWLVKLNIAPGLENYQVEPSQIEALAAQAILDGCHATNPVPVTLDDFRALYRAAL